jgi:putative FmdB family regulatory protein
VPIYEYRCTKCGKQFEVFQKITDEPLKLCKFCSGELQRLISESSFQLKGSGWYVTDYKRKEAKSESTPAAGKADST